MLSSLLKKTITLIVAWLLSANAIATKVTVYVIGDSTASIYAASSYPRTGWAQILQPFFNVDSVVINDQASSGRSSKSFYDEGKWTTVKNMLKAGDYVLIQFAHNDEKTDDAARYTNPATTFRDYLTIFANDTKAKGAYPVFISSIPRNNWSGTTIQQAHTPYTNAMKETGVLLSVPFIDMEASTMAALNVKGKNYVTDSVFLNLKAGVWPNYSTGNSDGTHFQENGAFLLTKSVLNDFKNHTQYPEVVRLSKNIVNAYRISAMPFPALKGTVTGYGIFQQNKNTTLTATASTGYKFSKWTLSTDTITLSRNNTYTITGINRNIDILARFDILSSTSNKKESVCKIYPTTVYEQLFIETPIDEFSVLITDLYGRSLLKINNSKSVNMRQFKPGIYMVQVKSNQQNILSTRIVKL